MGRKRLASNELKIRITIRIRQNLIDRLKTVENYNKLIEDLIQKYFDEKL